MSMCDDPHELPRRRQASRRQLDQFLRNGTGSNQCLADDVDGDSTIVDGVCSYPACRAAWSTKPMRKTCASRTSCPRNLGCMPKRRPGSRSTPLVARPSSPYSGCFSSRFRPHFSTRWSGRSSSSSPSSGTRVPAHSPASCAQRTRGAVRSCVDPSMGSRRPGTSQSS